MPGLVMKNEARSVSLVTSSASDSAQYRLLELTPDLVRQFESAGETSKSGLKRSREEEEADDYLHDQDDGTEKRSTR